MIQATDTLGVEQTGPTKSLLLVDQRASKAQHKALIALAKKQAGKLLANVTQIQRAPISIERCECKGNVCAILQAGKARVETRCLNDKHDKICGNEHAYYPPLIKTAKAKPALAVDHSFVGTGLGQKWKENGRRSAYVGTFLAR